MSARRPSSLLRALVVGCLVAVPALTATASTGVGAAAPVGNGRQYVSLRLPATAPARRVNAQWNAIAVRTIVSDNLTPVSVAPLYQGPRGLGGSSGRTGDHRPPRG